ncbi:Aminoglycoside 3-N-acetyltransferase [Natronoarchaeum philippinense]|uniref:Aminoglycoside 3-N-acetyltransferase n=1 Tax=Natronoarchaeum philippinense TaxID=558529 RepID=A0A285NRA9_NATPI|nr:AAC(3) family N-acetyltransferase [Natronoarchaeum philippinense]SNZ12050.1 Aminoglycoside 3-N-acetyltransferase [Natronoarchaeum philippinense]
MVAHLPETLWRSATHYVRKRRDTPTGPSSSELFESILSEYDEETVFVHAGLSDVRAAFGGDPYEFLLDRLDAEFESILTPGFTQSFRETGYFHRAETEPAVGAFSSLLFEDADYRTRDPLHSILVRGEYRFEDRTHRDTFAPAGCFGKLNDDGVRILNVGTPWLVSTQLHYVERVLDVPYTRTMEVEGTVEYADGDREEIVQRNYSKNKYVYYWNRLGIQRDLMTEGVLDVYDLNGLSVLSVRADDLLDTLEPKIEADPYYLVR